MKKQKAGPALPRSVHDGGMILDKLYQVLRRGLGLDSLDVCRLLLDLLHAGDIYTEPALPVLRPYKDGKTIAVVIGEKVYAGREVKVYYQDQSVPVVPAIAQKRGRKEEHPWAALENYLLSVRQYGSVRQGVNADWLADFSMPPIDKTGVAHVADIRPFKRGEVIYVPSAEDAESHGNYLIVTDIKGDATGGGTIALLNRSLGEVAARFLRKLNPDRVAAPDTVQRHIREMQDRWQRQPPPLTPLKVPPILQIERQIAELTAEERRRAMGMLLDAMRLPPEPRHQVMKILKAAEEE